MTKKFKTLTSILVLIVLTSLIYVSVPKTKPVYATSSVATETVSIISVENHDVFEGPAGKFCVKTMAEQYYKGGIDTRQELRKSGIGGPVHSRILNRIVAKEEAQKEKARRLALAKVKSVTSSNIVSSNGNASSSNQRTAGNWKGTHAEWDAIAIATLKSKGCTSEEVIMMMSIHHGEGLPNAINHRGPFYGGWQLKESIAMKIAWWDPAVSTARALKYVNGHVYKGYGSGIKAAYLHKQRYDWY